MPKPLPRFDQQEFDAWWQHRIERARAHRAMDKWDADSEMGFLGFYVLCILFLVAGAALILQAVKGGAR
jgi:hypothetical protein